MKFSLTIILVIFATSQAFAEIMNITANENVDKVGQYLIQSAMNEQKEGAFEITQKELQETLRFIHVGQVSSMQLLELKMQITETQIFKSIEKNTQVEILNLLRDITDVNLAMDQHRQEGKWCRFNLRNNPWDEVSDKSFFKNPEKYIGQIPQNIINAAIELRTDRVFFGQCWGKKEDDYLFHIGIDPQTLKPMGLNFSN